MPSLRHVALFALLAACTSGTNTSPNDQPSAAAVHSSRFTTVAVEVDYQTGATPYVGSAGRLDDVWQIARDNGTRAFQATKKTFTIPNQIASMEEIKDFQASSFTSDKILAIAAAHRNTRSADATAAFYVVFLNGLYDDGTGPQSDVLGVSLGNSGVIAMFKPVIRGSESGLPGVSKVLEQSTLVHELGHAFGLVDDGVALKSAHEDGAHPHHCTNESCVMNWSAERLGSAINIAHAYLTTGSTVVFDEACLADLDAAH
jgi:predicted Zn-dependent protease